MRGFYAEATWEKNICVVPHSLHQKCTESRRHHGFGGIDAEVAEALELVVREGRCAANARLELPVGDDLEGVRVQVLEKVAAFLRILARKRRSYSRTSQSTACSAETQCSVAFGRRPSGASPPRVAGSYVARSSTMFPAASFTTYVQVMKYAERSRTSRPGARRKNFFGGSSMKSSRSM